MDKTMGSSLLEVCVALGLMSAVFAGVGSAMSLAMRMHKQAVAQAQQQQILSSVRSLLHISCPGDEGVFDQLLSQVRLTHPNTKLSVECFGPLCRVQLGHSRHTVRCGDAIT